MDSLLDKMINLNVELEGSLRVVKDRRSPEALEAARNKIAELSKLFQTVNIKQEERATQVKEQEAEGAEEAPLAEPATPDGPEMLRQIKATADEQPLVKDSKPKDIRKCFTLNDRFLFKRELFANNDEEFNATLELLSSMASFDEVEEYVYDDLRWDRLDQRVKSFMNIIRSYFA